MTNTVMLFRKAFKLTVMLRPFGLPHPCNFKTNFFVWKHVNTNSFCAKRFCSFKKNSVLENDFSDNSQVNENEKFMNMNKDDGKDKTEDCTLNRNEIFKEIARGDPNVEKKLKKLEFEIALLEDQQFNVPSKINSIQWEELLRLKSVNSRKKYLTFLFKNEKKNENQEIKKQQRAKMLSELKKNTNPDEIIYGLGNNSLFLRIHEKSLVWLHTEKLIRANLFSQQVVFDCSYETFMSEINCKYTAHQLKESFMYNYKHPAPFHVKLCNVDYDSRSYKYFSQFKPTVSRSNFMWDIHKESYLDLYPKEKLVYLSPNAEKDLKTFNHDDVYIIGAFVDKGTNIKASYGKAKEENIRMAKLPIDLYLRWEKGLKSLPINIVLGILLDMRLYQDWNVALKRIPRRFLTPQKDTYKRPSNRFAASRF